MRQTGVSNNAMKPLRFLSPLISSALLLGALPANAASPTLKADVEKAIAQGLDYLKAQQKEEGFWVTPEEPALSALVITALAGDPQRTAEAPLSEPVNKGYDFLLKNVQPDGGIYKKARANYNTSISLTALLLRGKPEDEQIIRKARQFVAGQQTDADEKGKTDNPFDGGIGYSTPQPGAPAHADLSNMAYALEALYYSKKHFEDTGKPVPPAEDLNWSAAIEFVSRCQNREGSNDQEWAGKDKENIGAFTYTPEAPKGGEPKKGNDGRVAMRYYGSISYAGMLSFIYAGLTPDDPRVQSALQWLGQNYTVNENPGMGASGLYYYYHTMSKALATAGLSELQTKSAAVDWREELSRKLLSLQNTDGSWKNTESGRWMESDPVLVTAYTVLSLEQVWRTLK